MARYNAKREKKRGSDKVKSWNASHFGLTIFWFVWNRKIEDIIIEETIADEWRTLGEKQWPFDFLFVMLIGHCRKSASLMLAVSYWKLKDRLSCGREFWISLSQRLLSFHPRPTPPPQFPPFFSSSLPFLLLAFPPFLCAPFLPRVVFFFQEIYLFFNLCGVILGCKESWCVTNATPNSYSIWWRRNLKLTVWCTCGKNGWPVLFRGGVTGKNSKCFPRQKTETLDFSPKCMAMRSGAKTKTTGISMAQKYLQADKKVDRFGDI